MNFDTYDIVLGLLAISIIGAFTFHPAFSLIGIASLAAAIGGPASPV